MQYRHVKKIFIFLCLLSAFPIWAEEKAKPPKLSFANDSELGVVVSSGNSPGHSFNLSQKSVLTWSRDVFQGELRFYEAKSNSVESAKNYLLGLRYERILDDRVHVFLGQNLESDIYRGFNQRYNTDVGAKYFWIKENSDLQKNIGEKNFTDKQDQKIHLSSEVGYRFTRVYPTAAPASDIHFLRLYSEVEKYLTPTLSGKYWLECLPDLTSSHGFLVNSEISVSSAIGPVFSLKAAFLWKYDNNPEPGITFKTDTTFTTALVAKF